MPLVTVIVPTYARPALLCRAIESVLRQTWQRFEILVVDDCSPDDTAEVVRSFRDPRIHYLRHAVHRGRPGASRNTGIRAARGECLAFLDDDDEWRAIKLERQLERMAQTGCDAVLCAWAGSSGRVWRHKRAYVRAADVRRGNEYAPGSALLVRAAVMRDCLFDESMEAGEDWDVLIRLALRGAIAYAPESLLVVNEGGHRRMTNRARGRSVAEIDRRITVVRKHSEFFGGFWYRRHLAAALLSYIWERKGKGRRFAYALRQCGPLPVAMVLGAKVRDRLRLAARFRPGTANRISDSPPNT